MEWGRTVKGIGMLQGEYSTKTDQDLGILCCILQEQSLGVNTLLTLPATY